MASWCLDENGRLISWPRAGGWHDQDEYELKAMRLAHRAYLTTKFPGKWQQGDADFILWLNEDD